MRPFLEMMIGIAKEVGIRPEELQAMSVTDFAAYVDEERTRLASLLRRDKPLLTALGAEPDKPE